MRFSHLFNIAAVIGIVFPMSSTTALFPTDPDLNPKGEPTSALTFVSSIALSSDANSIGFVCRQYVQLIRHSHKFSERLGFHLGHHAGSVNFNGLFGRAKLETRLLVE